MRKIISIVFLAVVLCSFAAAQNDTLAANGAYSVFQSGNRTVYMIAPEIPTEIFQPKFDEIDSRLQALESKKEILEGMSVFDYLSIINLVLVIILFVFLLKRKPKNRTGGANVET